MNHRNVLHQFDATPAKALNVADLAKLCDCDEPPKSLSDVRAAIQSGCVDCEEMSKAIAKLGKDHSEVLKAEAAKKAGAEAAKKASAKNSKKTKTTKGKKNNEGTKRTGQPVPGSKKEV